MQDNTTQNAFTDLTLDEEERELETALERGEFKENPDFQTTKKATRSSCSTIPAAQYL